MLDVAEVADLSLFDEFWTPAVEILDDASFGRLLRDASVGTGTTP